MRIARPLLAAVLVSGLAVVVLVRAAPASEGATPAWSNLTSTAHDLGTLGGETSDATAVDGTIVVGSSLTASRQRHAFAYDLAADEPEMIDLGHLGGDYSVAVDVDGTVVVGTSKNAADEYRAFAYDLAADEPSMIDLGTLGAPTSRATAIDGSIVVGHSYTAAREYRAFAYDLAADEPEMVDLGTTGEGGSGATAVDGSIVVGNSYFLTGTSSYPYVRHAFAYDLAADEPEMIDLGTLGGWESVATAVEGTVVVGRSNTSRNPQHAFAYDLAAAEPEMIDLGVLGRDMGSKAANVDGGVVVGTSSSTRASNRFRPFAYDLDAPEPAMRKLATMRVPKTWATGIDGDVVTGQWRIPQRGDHAYASDLGSDGPRSHALGTRKGSEAADVDGNVVVGWARYGSRTRATAWVLRETARPMFGFRRFDQPRVKEHAGRVTIRVFRYGRTDRAVTVRYRTHSDTAKAGKDFVATSGRLRFARGVTRQSFTVKIRNDRRSEGKEYLLLTLSRPGKGALLGTPRWSQLRIKASDR